MNFLSLLLHGGTPGRAQRSGPDWERRRKGAGEGCPEGRPEQKRTGLGEEAHGSGRGMPGGASRAEADFAPTKEQGVSRMLTINLNDVEKELKIR